MNLTVDRFNGTTNDVRHRVTRADLLRDAFFLGQEKLPKVVSTARMARATADRPKRAAIDRETNAQLASLQNALNTWSRYGAGLHRGKGQVALFIDREPGLKDREITESALLVVQKLRDILAVPRPDCAPHLAETQALEIEKLANAIFLWIKHGAGIARATGSDQHRLTATFIAGLKAILTKVQLGGAP